MVRIIIDRVLIEESIYNEGGNSDIVLSEMWDADRKGTDFCHKCGTNMVYENMDQSIEPNHIATEQEKHNIGPFFFVFHGLGEINVLCNF